MMDYLTLFWLVLFLPSSWLQSKTVQEVCGVTKTSCPEDDKPRITGGRSSCAERAPWNAIIENQEKVPVGLGVSVSCGGVLVTERHVLTAAHCLWSNIDLGNICPKEFEYTTAEDCKQKECPAGCFRAGKKVLTVYLGISNKFEPGFGLSDAVEQIDVHPGWITGGFDVLKEGHDIAVLSLRREVDIINLPNIKPACLPTYNSPEVGDPVEIAGFGVQVSPGDGRRTYPQQLQSVTVYIESKEDCRSYWNIRGSQICAKGQVDFLFPEDSSVKIIADSCEGDSGGGLTATTGPDNRSVVYGLTSFGEFECGKGSKPGVYTNVYDHMDWITPIISDLGKVCGSIEYCYSLDHPACAELVCSYKAGRISKQEFMKKKCATNPSKFCCENPEKKIANIVNLRRVVGGSSPTFASTLSVSVSVSIKYKVPPPTSAASPSLTEDNLDTFLEGVSCDSDLIRNEFVKTKDGANSTIGCPSYGLNCNGDDLETSETSNRVTNTWKECAIACRDDEFCLYWTWGIPEHEEYAKYCLMKDACDDEDRNSYWISGHYACDSEVSGMNEGSAAVKTTAVLLGGGNGGKTESYPCAVELEDIGELLELDAVVLNGSIIYCGGQSVAADASWVQSSSCFKNQGSSWIKIESMNIARSFFSLTTVGDKILAVGGYLADESKWLDSVELYNGSWTLDPFKLTFPRSDHCAVFISNGILMIGGGNATNYLSTVEIYDVEQGFIKELSPMPTARSKHACSLYNGEVWVAGGDMGIDNRLDIVEIYNPTENTWTPGPTLNSERGDPRMEVIDGELIVFGGYNGTHAYKSNERLVDGIWKEETMLEHYHDDFTSVVIPCV